MTPSIVFKKLWGDDDLVELTVEVCDGKSKFSNNVYIDINRTSKLVVELSFFREEVQSGLFEFKFGEFGPEYANGGFLAKLHFYEPGNLLVSTHQQSDFKNFSKTFQKLKLQAKPRCISKRSQFFWITSLKS